MTDGIEFDFEEYVRRFGDLPRGSQTRETVQFGEALFLVLGWWDEETSHLLIQVDELEGESFNTPLTVQEHSTLERDDYAFDDVRDALGSTLSEAVRAYFRREAAP